VSITTDPVNNSSLTGYKEIDLSYFYKGFQEYKTIIGTMKDFTIICLERSYMEVERLIWSAVHIMNTYLFKDPEVQKLYAADSGEHFDAVIVAQGPTASMNAFAYRFHAPLIGKESITLLADTLPNSRENLTSIPLEARGMLKKHRSRSSRGSFSNYDKTCTACTRCVI